MSWHFSQALVVACSEANSLDGATSEPWRLDDINVGSLPKDRTTANSILRQFGMTLQLIAPTTLNVQSTSKSCEALETASSLLEGSHAKTLVLQEEETVSKDFEAACGEKWHASLAKFNPLSSSWKTRQSLLIGEEFESLGDFARLGYDTRWGIMGAHEAGAPHFRNRIWILAHAERLRWWKFSSPLEAERKPLREEIGSEGPVIARPSSKISAGGGYPHTTGKHGQARDCMGASGERRSSAQFGGLACDGMAEGGQYTNRWYEREPELARLVDGMANRTHRLNASGNGQVPAVVRLAWETLKP